MNLLPAGHRVLIKLDPVSGEKVEKSKGGIIVNVSPEEEVLRQQQGTEAGTVIALGKSAYMDFTGDPWVKVGDRVRFRRYEGVYIEDGEDHYRILNDEDIFAKEKGTK